MLLLWLSETLVVRNAPLSVQLASPFAIPAPNGAAGASISGQARCSISGPSTAVVATSTEMQTDALEPVSAKTR